LNLSVLAFSFLTLVNPGFGQQSRAPSEILSAKEVFARFCELDSQASQLTPDGWQRIAALFWNPGKAQRTRIIVTDGDGQFHPTPEREKILVGREYIEYGQISLPGLHFSAIDGLPPGVKIREALPVESRTLPGGEAAWRIEGTVPDPLLSVDEAIRYVSTVRAATNEDPIRRNADRTLAALKHFR
jgi:hypothetical protein